MYWIRLLLDKKGMCIYALSNIGIRKGWKVVWTEPEPIRTTTILLIPVDPQDVGAFMTAIAQRLGKGPVVKPEGGGD
jgi:hypothetical protein